MIIVAGHITAAAVGALLLRGATVHAAPQSEELLSAEAGTAS